MDYTDYYDDWFDCWNCGGEGRIEDECECTLVADQCHCQTPTPRKCNVCDGAGGWNDEPTPTQEDEG